MLLINRLNSVNKDGYGSLGFIKITINILKL